MSYRVIFVIILYSIPFSDFYSTMSEFIVESEYSVCMKLFDPKMVGSVVGPKGENRKFIEFKYGCKIVADYDEGTIRIVGKVEEKVKKSQEMVMDYLSKCSLTNDIHFDLAMKIIGHDRATIENIRKSTGCHVKVIDKPCGTRNLRLYGKPSDFELAKGMVVDIIENALKSNFTNSTYFTMQPSCCFREKTVEKGFQEAKYIVGQLAPTPQAVFLEFPSSLNFDESKLEKKMVGSSNSLDKECMSPFAIRKDCAVLAPFKGVYYRARVLSYLREGNEMGVYVDFVDFGNQEWVNFFHIRYLEKRFCYPRLATCCQISNIKPVLWDSETLEVFREQLNDSTQSVSVKVYHEYSKSTHVVKIDLSLPGIGDLGDYMVDMEYAEWADHPFDINDQPSIDHSNVTSVPILVEVTHPAKPVAPPESKASFGFAPIVDITVFPWSKKRFTSTKQFKSSFKKSIMSAYNCANNILKMENNNFLEEHTLHFSTKSDISLYESSAGAALTLGILSVCLKFKIPRTVALTGAISERDGKVLSVGKLREKLLGAVNSGKEVFYVPRVNFHETGVSDDIEVKPVDSIYDILKDMF